MITAYVRGSDRIVPADSCPLCDTREGVLIDRIPYQLIWARLGEEWRISLTEETRLQHTPCPNTSLLQCLACGLQYFDPLCPGDHKFYGELSSLYASERWEFNVVQGELSVPASLLDVGCGEGAFLERIRGQMNCVMGFDFNTEAAGRGRARGLEIIGSDLDEFSSQHTERFDAISVFQVVEHLPRVVLFLQSILRCLKPGGAIYISAPNRERLYRPALESLDCPPHHVSRWSSAQLRTLGRLLNLSTDRIWFEDAELSQVRAWFVHSLSVWGKGKQTSGTESSENWFARQLGRLLVNPYVYQLGKQYDWLQRHRLYGTSVLAKFTKGEARC